MGRGGVFQASQTTLPGQDLCGYKCQCRAYPDVVLYDSDPTGSLSEEKGQIPLAFIHADHIFANQLIC